MISFVPCRVHVVPLCGIKTHILIKLHSLFLVFRFRFHFSFHLIPLRLTFFLLLTLLLHNWTTTTKKHMHVFRSHYYYCALHYTKVNLWCARYVNVNRSRWLEKWEKCCRLLLFGIAFRVCLRCHREICDAKSFSICKCRHGKIQPQKNGSNGVYLIEKNIIWRLYMKRDELDFIQNDEIKLERPHSMAIRSTDVW